ncbi:MAG TPA: PAS domain S-box protein [Longimicrobiales bacterium]|nr:PAS domain S-box protein [Longimicrobiales bacterium]
MDAAEYRAIFDSSPDGCLVVDGSGIIRAANPRVEELFGWTPEQLLGQKVEVLVPEMHREAHSGHRSRFVADPHNRPMGVGLDLRGARRDGTTFPVEISLSPWAAGEGGLRVICTVRDVSEYRRLRNFSEGALQATEEERRRIARELHDDTAQRLATLILRVRRLAEERDHHKRSQLHEEIREELVDAAEGVKRMARGLRPPEIEELGLALAITAHVRSLREGAGFEVQAELDAVDHALSVTAKLALYRIVQEALSNARRYSGVDRARIRLFLEDGTVVAEVSDEGIGFTQSQALESGGGLGLVGMKERAAMVGGRLTIDGESGKGTKVTVTVPVGGREKDDG